MALVYELQNTYYSRFERDRTGRYDIDSEYFMPVVRDVPVFPERDLNPGDSWKERGEEVHDLRNGYGIPIPLRFPFLANYRYLGPGEYRGRVYELISVNYRVQHRTSEYFKRFSLYPVRVSGFSDQLIYWDMEKGRPHAYNEQFSIIFSLSNGDEYEFTGTARAEITESLPMDRERIAEDVEKQIQENGVQDTLVSIDERGVTIKLEDIRFAADSAELLDSELRKLERIADILRRYPDRHLLVTGHTALAGTAAGRMQLSLDRAHTVAAFFLDRGVRSPDQIVTEGKGATEPVADNSSPEGMRKNRRVEITILEN
jgi:outer membrane protein OmpA-like peptidoglycan-associated protein